MELGRTVMKIRVGILDTGVQSTSVAASASFLDEESQDISAPSASEHGSKIATIIRANASAADLLDARAFATGHPSTPARIAEAIDWLIEQNAHVINMSFSLENNDEVLSAAVAHAQAAGLLCVASRPAQGVAVFPATYDGVVSVSGDARCSAGEFSLLQEGPNWHFGAANGGPSHRAHQRGHGSSFACAHVSGALAQLISTGLPHEKLLTRFAEHCYWTGIECRQ